MVGGDTTAGRLLRALRYVGRDGIGDAAVQHVRSILNDKDRDDLLGLQRVAPTWMQPIVERVTASDSSRAA
jgi:hypothetical protein